MPYFVLAAYILAFPPARYLSGRLHRHFNMSISRFNNLVFFPAEAASMKYPIVRQIHNWEWDAIAAIHRAIYGPREPVAIPPTPPPPIVPYVSR